MAPVAQSWVENIPDVLHLPQLWLGISTLLLLILLTVSCSVCKRFIGKQGTKERLEFAAVKEKSRPTQITDTSPNGEFPRLHGDKTQEAEDDLYEVVSEVNVNKWEPDQEPEPQPGPSPGQANSAQSFAVAGGGGHGSGEPVEPTEPQENMAIYAKVVKQKHKGSQIERQAQVEEEEEEEEEEPPPVPEKHLDDGKSSASVFSGL